MPPPLTPEYEAATRARLEAEQRAKLEPELRASVAQNVEWERRRAWIDRGRLPEPPAVPLRTPLVGGVLTGEIGTLAGRPITYLGATAAMRVRFHGPVALELGASFLSMDFNDTRFAVASLEPSVLLMVHSGEALVYCRGGLDVSRPLDGGPAPPSLMLGGFLGIGVELLGTPIGDGGYVGMVIDVRGLLRGGIGGEDGAMRTVRTGLQVALGPSFAF
jgi:hypothetical protein